MTRPESLRLVRSGEAGPDALRGRILDRRFAGGFTYYRVSVASGRELLVAVTGRPIVDDAGEVGVELLPDGTARAFPATEP